jgi:hypothetical protein
VRQIGSDQRIDQRDGEGDMIADPFLNYFALGLLFFVVIVLFYGIIAIHDIPHLIAKSRDHPHQDAIHAAGWVSLFTLHALWPFLWIWAMAYRPDRGWGVSRAELPRGQATKDRSELNSLQARIDALEMKLASYRVEAIRPIERMESKIATEPTQTKVATGGR